MLKFSYDLRQQLQDRKEALGHSWSEFKKLLFREFPDSVDNGQGSMVRLQKIVAVYRKATDWDLEKLRAYHRTFKLEAAKLMRDPPMISNFEAIGFYLAGLELSVRERVQIRMADWFLNKLDLETEDGRRRMDPWKLQEVMEQAEMIMSASSGDVYIGLGSFALGAGVPPVNPGVGTVMLSAAMPLSYPFQPPPVLPTMNITLPSKPVSVKQKESFPDILDKTKEEAELRTMGIATSVDAHTVSIKAHDTELAALKKGMEDVKTLSTEVKDIKMTLVGMPGQIIVAVAGQTNRSCDGNNNNMVRGKPGQPMIGRGKYLCFYCNEDGHRLRDCPYQREIIQKEWIIWNNGAGKYTLRDGTGFPKVEPREKLKDRVAEYVKQQGCDRIVHPDAHLFMEVEDEPVVYQAAVVQPQGRMDLDMLAMLLAEKMKPATDMQSKN
ncbi:hypothetical protein WG66_004183 [Moniliophthora roreri]|nr:hypothetical protein WG66_004183 [Moniliophthora roreri]